LTWNNFDIKRLGATIGAEISGVDLTTDLPQEVKAENMSGKIVTRSKRIASSYNWNHQSSCQSTMI
jgi:hypothetical protein